MANGTFWDSISEQLQTVGLNTSAAVSSAIGQKIVGKVGGASPGGATGAEATVKQDPSVTQTNPWDLGGLQNISETQIAGIGLPVILVGAAVLYFVLRKA